MKKSARILVSLLSLLTFTVCLSGVAAAEEIGSSVTAEGTVHPELQNGIEVNMQEGSKEESSLIKQWNCTIADNSDGTVAIYGETMAYGTVDYLDVEVFLQRWNGSSWIDVTSRTYSDSSCVYVRGSASIKAAGGYSYRCRAVHHAEKAGANSAKASVSKALLVQ